jgi:hypothetical protein
MVPLILRRSGIFFVLVTPEPWTSPVAEACTPPGAVEAMIWKGRYLRMRPSMMRNRIRQITNQKTISTPTMATKNPHRGMLPRSEAINARSKVPSIVSRRNAPANRVTVIEGRLLIIRAFLTCSSGCSPCPALGAGACGPTGVKFVAPPGPDGPPPPRARARPGPILPGGFLVGLHASQPP